MAFTSSYTDGLIQQSEYYYGTPDVSLTGSFTGSFAGDGSQLTGVGGGSTDTGSLLTTASVSLNTITFTKGDGSTFPITVDTGSGGGGGVPSGTVSSSAQITELGFVTSSATSSFVLNSQTSSMSVATASYVEASNIDGTVSNALSSSHAQRSDATDTIDVTQGSANTNRYVTFTSAINSDGALLADPGILYNPFSNTLTVANITGTASLASAAESVEYSNVNNKPTLISSSAQIATEISGAFVADSASFSTRITSNETNITSLTTATSSYVLNSQTSSMSVATASYVETAQTASYVLQSVSASYAPTAPGILSSSAQIATDISGAFSADSASFSTRVTANETSITSLNSVTGSYAITGSNTFTGNQTINGNLTVNGTGSFDVIHTIYETSSIIYASGSTKFGDTMDDTHVRTGSMFITGSVTALDYTGIFNGALSSSAQIASDISGAFATDSASFSTRITTNETDISTLTAATASYILASQTSSMTVLSSSFAVSASYAPSADAFPFVGDAVITGSLIVSGSNLTSGFRTDTRNIILGYGAGNNQNPTNGPYNVMIGYQAGYTNTTGDSNVCIGQNAGYALGTNASDDNILIGKLAGAGGTSPVARMSDANWNIGLGNESLLFLTSGDYNIGFGYRVMRNISSGQQNVGLGRQALYSVNSGDNNIGIGYNAGLNQTTGDGNITIGSGSLGIAGESNQLRIGNGNTITTISASLTTGDIIFPSTASATYFVGDGSNVTGVISASYAVTASYIETAQTASYVVTAQTASYVISSSIEGITNYVRNDQTSSMTVLSSSFAITASHALNAGGGTPTFIASGSTSASAAPDTGVVVNHSGSTAFSVIGDVGTLFSVDDDLNGMLFTANDISGFPVLQASASGEVYVGKTPQSLYTTAVISSTTAATTHSLCTLSTSSYDGAFFEYTAQSASNARAGNIMSTWNGSNIVYAETTTTDIGRTPQT